MSVLARVRSWLRSVFRRPDLNREIDQELAFHVDQYAADLERRGVSAAEASRRARAELGSFTGRRQEIRQALGLRLLDELRGDIRYAVRLLIQSPGFTLVALLSLGVGIGANTAIFSLVDEVLLKSLPVSQPDRLYFVDNTGGKSDGRSGPPYPCYELLRDTTHTFSGLAMFNADFMRVAIDGVDERVRAQYASGNYFDVLGVPAFYGRTLTPADDLPGGQGGPDGPVVVISYAYWQKRFGGNPQALGKRIGVTTNRGTRTVTIVGVTPPSFFGMTVGEPIDLTLPVTLSNANLAQPKSWWFSVVGRLANGASVDAARSELDAVFRTFMTSTFGHPPTPGDNFNRIELVPANRGLHEIRRQFAAPLAIVMAVVSLVLAIGCANVANLLLARANARDTEMAVRAAIGAGRGRLMRQLLTEGLVLSGLGAVCGLLFAKWGSTVLVRMVGGTPQQIALTPALDGRVLAFATAIALATGILCSLAPAVATTRVARANAAGAGHISLRRFRGFGQALVVVQVALSLVLLCGAALFVRTLQNLDHADAGFRPADVLTVPVEAVLTNPPAGVDPEVAKARIGRIWQELADRAGQIPGVQVSAAATLVPMSGRDRGVNLNVVGAPALTDDQRYVRLNHVNPTYFDALKVRVIAGRVFVDTDAKAVVLGHTAARTYFGDSSPIGRFVDFGNPTYGQFEVVGVVEDTQYTKASARSLCALCTSPCAHRLTRSAACS